MKNERLRGKTIVITGASGGLGEQLAYMCAQNGANLYLLARNQEKLDRISASIREQYNVKCTPIALDVSKYDHIPKVFQRIYDQAGEIDVLVNNAGYGVFTEAGEVELADLEGMFAVNVVGLIACTKEVIPFMCKRKSGHIINIASQAGKLATPKSSVYSATKHAVLGYTNSLRMEMSQCGVFVTAVNPGPIRTGFFQTADPDGSYLENLGRFILNPKKVADNIVAAMLTNRREINMPSWMNWVGTLHTLMPNTVERLGRKAFFKK
ncbi:SDR family NAD(P)-dependent oxidoreductase [Lederbergia citrea]|uniref:SDR family oxidoreductase n=1 Tax=Lederbergia citrea TaxID=2833581 RepID=A0A942Z4D9_9BACI|nr:SDR family oxidoreductase [Lederbergia citrea]MBS4176425.1 SDR family oxidoreductase [Lederbergia citrea]MBS4202986.1 SDR family oxidoreductase [Lederbergia citrea]MBS4222342.1 SDR family oxidoreductase [Lederbergia citrea]